MGLLIPTEILHSEVVTAVLHLEVVTVVLCWEDVIVIRHWEAVTDVLNSVLAQVPDSWPSYCSCVFRDHTTLAVALVVYLRTLH